ncbi:MAG: rod shape-determining protein MreC [Bacilli bacterium]
MKNKHSKKCKFLIIIALILSILSIFYYILKDKNNLILPLKFTKDTGSIIVKTVSFPIKYITKFKEMNKIYNNYNKDVKRLENYSLLENLNKEYLDTIDKLKALNDIKNVYTAKEFIHASILQRNYDYFFDIITIDKGLNSNIENDLPVINNSRLIGITTNCSNISCDVKLLTSKKNSYNVSVIIESNNNKYHGILTGYKDGFLEVNLVEDDKNIKEGDLVYTSSYSTKFPSGILIGSIEKISTDSNNIMKILHINFKEKISNLKFVTIIKGDL